MTYVNPFDATQISGGTQAKLIDDKFRALYGALIERLDDKITVSSIADPWVLKDSLSGRKTGKILTIPFNHFTTLGGGSTTISLDKVTTSGDANALVAGFSLPNGCTITSAAVYVGAPTTGMALELYKVTGASPFTKVSIAAWSTSTVGQHVSDNGTILAELTDGAATYYLSVDLSSTSSLISGVVYGARVVYDAPTHLNTL